MGRGPSKVMKNASLQQPLPWSHCPFLCHPEQPTCLWQVEKEMTLQSRHGCEARRAGHRT
jgi:hypothetical protein